MGSTYSNYETRVNYNCPVCMEKGLLPNLAGNFYLINDTQCKCNGCNTVFDKKDYYKKYNPKTRTVII